MNIVNIKKWLAAAAIISLTFPAVNANADYDQNGAQNYLAAHGDNPWSVMALAALGQTNSSTAFLTSISGTSAISYEAPILAITALGQNPRTLGSTDYIAALKTYHADSQIGDPATINDDIFGILALVSAGESLSDPAIIDAKNFILNHQNNNSGWGFAVTSDSDTNITASAVLAILAAGVNSSDSHIQNALSFLQNSQNSDGGFPYNPGTDSDSSSTAWVIWSLNALNINPATWTKSDKNPIAYLESNQNNQGYFKFQPNSNEDSFSPITTAYATIALQGKSLPIRIITNNDSQQKFPFRIEGSAATVCSGETTGPTALDLVKNAKDICGYAYEIKETSFGPYLNQINSDTASGITGWMYLVNNISPAIGASDYKLQSNDSTLWYFGDFGWMPIKLSLSSAQINSNQSAAITVESFSSNLWSPLSGATVYYGTETAITGDNGKANISPKDGFYKIYAQKQKYIRSNTALLQVGQPSASTVDLSININQTNQKPKNFISFTITPDTLDFGTLTPGSSSMKNLTINNTGSINIHIESIVSGDAIFTQNLNLNSLPWENFKTVLAKDNSQTINASLSVPADYAGNGAKSGQLTIWAMAE